MSTENLYNKEAKQKIKDIVEDVKIAMMATNLGSKPLSVVPMYTKKVDEDGQIWFLSALASDHNVDIIQDTNIQLLYSGPSDKKFLSLYGHAEINTDQDKIDELYSKMDNAWFDGTEDANISIIKFTPTEAAYWSNDSNKLVTLFKLAKAAVTGKDQKIGSSGKLKV